MKLTVLGNYGPYPKEGGGATSGYLLTDNDLTLLLDCGAGTLTRLLQFTSLTEVDAVFISHLHFDHTSDLLPLRYLLDDLKHTLTVITQYEDSEYYRVLFTHPRLHVINIDENSTLTIKGKELSFYLLDHPARDYAVKVKGTKTFAYTGDTRYCENLKNVFHGSDAVLADCAKPAGYTGPHLASDRAIEASKQSGAKLLVTHFAPGDNAEAYYQNTENTLLTQEGCTYSI